jgi:hypothetical protein
MKDRFEVSGIPNILNNAEASLAFFKESFYSVSHEA